MNNLNSNFKFKKQFGQNFIFDKNFLLSLVNQFNLNKNSQILEIGAGAGTLTEVLAQNFKKVISFEIDKTLKENLLLLQNKYQNLQFIFEDILKSQTSSIDKMFENDFYLIANLPYYITSQIIFKFLIQSKKIKKMFVMVQKEVGERFSANPSTRDYGVPSVLINTFGSCKILKQVNRKMFTPQPKVDSCVIEISIEKNKNNINDAKNYSTFITNCFSMKRKTLYNNLVKMGYPKEDILENFKILNITQNSRPENLTSQTYVNLYNTLLSTSKTNKSNPS